MLLAGRPVVVARVARDRDDPAHSGRTTSRPRRTAPRAASAPRHHSRAPRRMILRKAPRSRLFITFRSNTWPSSCSSTPRRSPEPGAQEDRARAPACRRSRPRTGAPDSAARRTVTRPADRRHQRRGRPRPASGPSAAARAASPASPRPSTPAPRTPGRAPRAPPRAPPGRSRRSRRRAHADEPRTGVILPGPPPCADYDPVATRAVSSAGQSACLTSRRSPVRARDRPSHVTPSPAGASGTLVP